MLNFNIWYLDLIKFPLQIPLKEGIGGESRGDKWWNKRWLYE
jgi:hypothetical protein